MQADEWRITGAVLLVVEVKIIDTEGLAEPMSSAVRYVRSSLVWQLEDFVK